MARIRARDYAGNVTFEINPQTGRIMTRGGAAVTERGSHIADVSSISAHTIADTTHTIADPAAITAANPPAGGTGATEGAYDSAAHRDEMITSLTNAIADITAVRTQVVAAHVDIKAIEDAVKAAHVDIAALVTEAGDIRTKFNALLAVLESMGEIATS